MDFFCVRIKPRYSRRNHKKKNNKKDETKISTIQVEGRPSVEPTRKKKPRKQAHRRSRVMAHPCAHADFPASGREEHCPCAHCRSQPARPLTRNPHCDHGPSTDPPRPEGPDQENQPHLPRVNRAYVHPYSTYHYRFPVVDHSTTCYGQGITPYPTYYTALVPEAAAVRDIETVLAHRQGLVAMARLLATEELVHIGTFHCIRALYEASSQLEVWDGESASSNE
ncbi:hypothetical protein F5X98DRAFT_305003 [Xylaria grammica]|nr:hypothetical protein F5X98DRAFT_305003 [Xylaria grammica]